MRQAILFILFFCLLGFTKVEAQQYKTAAGLRLGYPLALTGKMFVHDNHAVEGILSFRGGRYWSWFGIGGAYLVHNPLDIEEIEDTGKLEWYYGGGASIYIWSYNDNWLNYYDERYSSTSFGISGYLGLEFTLTDTPVSFSLDWTPTVFLNGFDSGLSAGYGSLAARYIFKR